MVELELLAVVWATRKCKVYLMGLPHFTLVTDHQPLRSILDKKTLEQIDTPRIIRLKMALTPYNFTTVWLEGKKNYGPGALSRSPHEKAQQEDLEYEQELAKYTGYMSTVSAITIDEDEDLEMTNQDEDAVIREIKEHAKSDEEYLELKKAVIT